VLLPAIELVLRSHDVALADVEAFGLCVGPGSFTGLRVGMSTIKALALDSGRPVVTVTAPELPQRGASGHVDPAVLSAICMAHLLAGKTVEAAAVEPLYGAQPPIHTPTA
jgi:tRNA A37 threonylcarbamoyladenosine modification protein TsaB